MNREPRKPPRPVTPAYLEGAAKHYLERYASSAENLRRVLARKVANRCRLRGEEAAPFAGAVEEVVARAVRSGLVDDAVYAQARVASLRRRGGSARGIAAKLAAKGVARETVSSALDGTPEDEWQAAHALARRRRLGPYGKGDGKADRQARREKDLASLARAGFPFALARAVIDGEAEEAPGAGAAMPYNGAMQPHEGE